MENNGHTIEVRVNPGSYIVAGGVRYNLIQFHFHHPSEEAVKGKLTDMDITWCTRAPTESWPWWLCGWWRISTSPMPCWPPSGRTCPGQRAQSKR